MSQLIYEPRGAAKEYADLAVNIYKGCVHGCEYCYAPAATFTSKENFYSDVEIKKTFSLDKLQREVESWEVEKKPVLLSFTHDPYQPIEERKELVRESIKILKLNGFPIKILTKAGHLPRRDFDLLNESDWFGVTLTFTNRKISRKQEPEAAPPATRILNLYRAKENNINTWVSCEPVIKPSQTIELIKNSYRFVDHFKVGKWNHDKRANKIDWQRFGHNVIELLEKLDADYYIKKDLREHLGEE